jgi:hypothetical protein
MTLIQTRYLRKLPLIVTFSRLNEQLSHNSSTFSCKYIGRPANIFISVPPAFDMNQESWSFDVSIARKINPGQIVVLAKIHP